jgi:hypothetical protein
MCNYSLNAVNDLKEIMVNSIVTNLRTITEPRNIEIRLPGIDEQKAFKLVTTQAFSNKKLDASLKGKQMEVVLLGENPDANTLKLAPDAVITVKIYRRMAGEILWTEKGEVASSMQIMDPVTITIEPNGTATFDVQGEKKLIFLGEM